MPGANARADGPPTDPAARIGFVFCVIYVFLRFSFVHEIIISRLHINTYLVLITGSVGLILTLISGGIARTLSFRPAVLWLLFVAWCFMGIPFSTWVGGSLGMAIGYLKAQVPLPFIMAGLTRTKQQIRILVSTVALAAGVNVITARLFSGDAERLTLQFGSIADSNDYAAHLLTVLPFVLLVLLSKRNIVIKTAALILLLGGIAVTGGTASRGGLVAFGAGCLFTLLFGTSRLKFYILAGAPVVIVGAAFLLQQNTLDRYLTMFGKQVNDAEVGGATGSTMAREHLFRQSLRITMEHPLLGVGVGEFMDFEGRMSSNEGRRGAWQGTHNGYMEISSETGIPGLLLYLACIFGVFGSLYSVYRRTGSAPEFADLKATAFCVMLSMVCFIVAMIFLTQAYQLYIPAFIGFGALITAEADRQMGSHGKVVAGLQASPGPANFRTHPSRLREPAPRLAR